MSVLCLSPAKIGGSSWRAGALPHFSLIPLLKHHVWHRRGTEANQLSNQSLHLFAERVQQRVATHFKEYITHGDIKIRGRSERVLTTGNRKMNLGKEAGRNAPSPSSFSVSNSDWGVGVPPHSLLWPEEGKLDTGVWQKLASSRPGKLPAVEYLLVDNYALTFNVK